MPIERRDGDFEAKRLIADEIIIAGEVLDPNNFGGESAPQQTASDPGAGVAVKAVKADLTRLEKRVGVIEKGLKELSPLKAKIEEMAEALKSAAQSSGEGNASALDDTERRKLKVLASELGEMNERIDKLKKESASLGDLLRKGDLAGFEERMAGFGSRLDSLEAHRTADQRFAEREVEAEGGA